MEDKPKIYQNREYKEFNNNRDVYMSYSKDKEYNVIRDINDIRKKINDIVNSNSFIYSKMVNIVMKEGIVSKKIIGLYNNSLVTIDNEYIPLENIIDIY